MSVNPEEFARRLSQAIPDAAPREPAPARISESELSRSLADNFKEMWDALAAADGRIKAKFGESAFIRQDIYNSDLKDEIVYGCVIASKPYAAPKRFEFKTQRERIWFRDFPFHHDLSGKKIVRTDYDAASIEAALERLLQALMEYFAA
jgi:hypothetical protein